MTKDLKTNDLNDLPLESIKVQLLDSFEEVSDTLQVIEKNWKRLENFGKLLIAAKTKVPHGEWEDWLVDTFQGRLQLRTAQRWISDAKFPAKAEERRAKDRESKNSKATDLSLLESDEPKGSVKVIDPDPTPDPPTQRKTAKGSEKVPEDKKPKTAAITPEILPDEPVDVVEAFDRTGRIIDAFVIQCDIEKFLQLKADAGLIGDGKRAAKALRKLADKLDPPTKFVKPDLEDVSAYFTELKSVDPESFFDFYESKGWMVGKVSMKNWQASARKWVRENATNGKANSNGATHRGTGKRRPTVEEVFG